MIFTPDYFLPPGKVRRNKIDCWLQPVGLEEDRRLALAKFSRGILQRLDVAQTSINDPDSIILDEPASGLDPIGQMEMRNLMLRLKQDEKTILLSSHQLTEVEQICDYVSVLNRGRLIAQGDLDGLLEIRGQFELVCTGLKQKGLKRLERLALGLARKEGRVEAVIEKSYVYLPL